MSTHTVIGKSAHSSIADVDAEFRGGTPKDTFSRSLQGVANKRARARLMSHRSSHPQKHTWLALDRSASSGFKSDDGVGVLIVRSKTSSIPHPCASAIAGMPLELSVEEQYLACRRYEISHQFPKGDSASIEQVIGSSAGIQGYLNFDPDLPMRVGQEVCSSTLCGLWAKKAISAVSDLPEWERAILTVDSGATETVVPPDVARNLPLLHTSQVGTEYEVANGGVVVMIGEKPADIITKLGNNIALAMSFQVVKVH